MFSKAGSSGGEEVMYESQMRRIAQIFRIMRILRSDFNSNSGNIMRERWENLNQDLQVGSTYNRPPDTCSNIAMQVVIIIIRPPRELINIKIPIITIIIL